MFHKLTKSFLSITFYFLCAVSFSYAISDGEGNELLDLDTGGEMRVRDASDNNLVVVQDNGSSVEMGIGIDDPSSELQVHDSTGQSTLNVSTDVNVGSGNAISIVMTSDADGTANPATLGMFNDGAMRFSGQGNLVTPDMILEDDGDFAVGIGTAGARFHVDSEAARETNIVRLENNLGDFDFFAVDADPDTLTMTSEATGDLAVDISAGNFYIYDGSAWQRFDAATDLQDVYDNDTDGSDATIALTADDDSIVIQNPSGTGTNTGTATLFIDQNDATTLAFEVDSESTTVDAVQLDTLLLTTGDALEIAVDSDTLTTGQALRILGTSDGATDVVTIGGLGQAVFNENGEDADFRIEGDTETNLLVVDASTDRVGIAIAAPTSGFHVEENIGLGRTASGAANVTAANEIIIGVDNTAASRTVTLPTAETEEGRTYIIKDESGGAGTNNIIIATGGAETIDGGTQAAITTDYGAMKLYSDGTNWFSLSSPFGTYAQYLEDETASNSVGSTAFVEKLSMTTASLPPGVYRIGWSYNYNHNDNGNDFQGRVQVDNTDTIHDHRQEPKDSAGTTFPAGSGSGTDQAYHVGGFDYYTVASQGTIQIDLDFATSSATANDDSTIWNARLEIWRVE